MKTCAKSTNCPEAGTGKDLGKSIECLKTCTEKDLGKLYNLSRKWASQHPHYLNKFPERTRDKENPLKNRDPQNCVKDKHYEEKRPKRQPKTMRTLKNRQTSWKYRWLRLLKATKTVEATTHSPELVAVTPKATRTLNSMKTAIAWTPKYYQRQTLRTKWLNFQQQQQLGSFYGLDD